MGLLDDLKSRKIQELTEPSSPKLEEKLEEKPATEPRELATNLADLPDFPEEKPATSETAALPSTPSLPNAAQQLTENEQAPGERLTPGLEHPLPSQEELLRQARNREARARSEEKRDQSPVTGPAALKPVASSWGIAFEAQVVNPNQLPADQLADEQSIATRPCSEDLRLMASKLKRFLQVFYLQPGLWSAKTLRYVFAAYQGGVPIKDIYNKVGAASKVFADAQGQMVPTFRNQRPEIGGLRLIDVYALLAGSLHIATFGKEKGYVRAELNEAVPAIVQRKVRHPGEVSLTTFVDLIYYDHMNPHRLGHAALKEWLTNCQEPMSASEIRRFYENILMQFRERWKMVSGTSKIMAVKKANTGDHLLRQLDEALTEHTAILECGTRRFLLIEWPEALPTELPRFAAVVKERPPSDLRLFLSRMAERFDPALPFDKHWIAALRQELGPQGSLTTPENSGNDPFQEK